jgi:hypothetical protein
MICFGIPFMRKAALLIVLAGVVSLGVKRLPGQSKERRREPTPLPTISVSACRDISSPGRYVVNQDLTTSLGSCITIHDTWKVDLECGGHNIAAAANYPNDILVTNAQEVGISHCVAHNPKENYGNGLSVSNGKDVRIIDNDFENVSISGSLYTFATNNHILGAYSQSQTSWTTFSDNVEQAYEDIYIGSPFSSNGGAFNQIVGNAIDGRWDGVSPPLTQGADDGILLLDEIHGEVANNAIQNVWDAGVESIGTLSDTVVVNNQITNIGLSAIASYYNTNWTNNVISGNQAKRALTLVDVEFLPGAPPATIYVFKNNRIEKILLPPHLLSARPIPITSQCGSTWEIPR